MLRFDVSHALSFLPEDWLSSRLPPLQHASTLLNTGEGPGGFYTGWVHLPETYDQEEFKRIALAASKIRAHSQALVVIGIGGSYLGARAVLELLLSPNYNLTAKDTPQIFFAGNTLSGDALAETLALVRDKDFSVNVISKSGTTTEPSVAFAFFKNLLEEKYGREGAKARIFATTDRSRGFLKTLADAEGYETFVIPDEIGGRYSVLTAVGLLPLAAAGIDLEQLLDGADDQMNELILHPGSENPAWQYAAARNALYQSGKRVEILASYEPFFRFFGEWWKQLYGESEGKDGRGLFPASVEFTADLHSMGQYIQDGQRILLETVVSFEASRFSPAIPIDPRDGSGLGFLRGKDLQFVNQRALQGTMLAHTDGGVPNLVLSLSGRNPYCIGRLIYFFEYACALSGYLLGVNPFDQPGVETYKENVYALLGKPGYEDRRSELERRLC